MGFTKDQLLDRLKELQINFVCYDHPVVLTVEAQAKYVGHLGGLLSKNLLLKDKKHRYYVVSALANTNVDLKVLSQRLGLGKGGLRMAPEESLQEILQVPLGCVTPFALINESAGTVSFLLDQGFKSQECCFFHPLSNDATISLGSSGLEKFLTSLGRKPAYVDLEATPLVGKDNPPDLADFVPSGVPALSDSAEKAPPIQPPVVTQAPENVKSTSGKASIKAKVQSGTTEKPKSTVNPLIEATDVEKVIEEIFAKFASAVQSENKQEEIETSLFDGVRKRITTDLQMQMMSFKNAAYSQGFQAGVEAVRIAMKNMSFRS
ncbi:prolyl-tRNA synthetase associated domain-containing protein 1 isoform X2 [Dioscorea cayenensis subsp. rotundata]|uniref:Prolyl-tRNA synthetase associated domain-containing protein 1 isoform X2 n=1 Tax=Dioscorea cayennensis subsp. rotundata TaxID=55577 RepID=A0AB40D1R7_DIOCR|nr:prolyl-tRNA synthetase associated domain-containing protein 1 isoform X2 [Dioscorea cayenensis subsp. rotundata]